MTASASGSFDSAMASSTASRSTSLPSSSTRCTAAARRARLSSRRARASCPSGPRRLRPTARRQWPSRRRRAQSLTLVSILLSRAPSANGYFEPKARSGPARSEDVQHQPPEHLVHGPHERHHDDDEHEHHDREAEELSAGRGDDLLQFSETCRMNSAMREKGFRRAARSRFALATTSSLGSSITFRATSYTFRGPAFIAGSQGGQDSNLQPAVLETAALPIEPPPYGCPGHARAFHGVEISADLSLRRTRERAQ